MVAKFGNKLTSVAEKEIFVLQAFSYIDILFIEDSGFYLKFYL
jgi:hypothetical protein